MKLREGFELHRIAEQNVAVPTSGAKQVPFCTVNLNETGLLLWKALSEERSEEELVSILANQYDADEETIRGDVVDFIALLRAHDLIE